MCTSYEVGEIDFRAVFGIDPPGGEWRREVYKDYVAPFVFRGGNAGLMQQQRRTAASRMTLSDWQASPRNNHRHRMRKILLSYALTCSQFSDDGRIDAARSCAATGRWYR
jgi:hypothetical protein